MLNFVLLQYIQNMPTGHLQGATFRWGALCERGTFLGGYFMDSFLFTHLSIENVFVNLNIYLFS